MNAKNLIIIGVVAVSVFALSHMILLPAETSALTQVAEAAEIQVLQTHGCKVTAVPAHAQIKPDETPAIKLTVSNPTDEAVTFDLAVTEMSANQMPMRRSIAMPTESWKTTCPMTLKAGETKTLTVTSETKAKPWDSFQFVITAGEASIRTAQIGTALPEPAVTEEEPAPQPNA